MSGTRDGQEGMVRNPCLSCRHYYLTYDPRQPYGCRAMGFKSAKAPNLIAFETSGMICQLMEPRHLQSHGSQQKK